MKPQRKAVDAEREIRKELIAHWADRPVASIAREDVIALVEAIAQRPAPYTAHIVLGHATVAPYSESADEDEARRIASNIAKLPTLLSKERD